MTTHPVCVVTGATSGIGLAVTENLASRGCTVIMVARNAGKGTETLQKLSASSRNSSIHFFQCDLSSQAGIRTAMRNISSAFPAIDVLINNAAQWTSRLELTEDGIETQFAVNHLAYVLTSHMLYPNLRRSDHGRIINIASDSHWYGKINFDDLNLSKSYHGLKAYGQSKLANVLFSYALDRKKREENISVYAVQPGLVKTDIGIKHTSAFHALMWRLRRLSGITAGRAAASITDLALSPVTASISGRYWDAGKTKASSKASYDTTIQDRLWDESLRLTGIGDFFEVRDQVL